MSSREEEILRKYSKSQSAELRPVLTDEVKRNVRESLIYAIASSLRGLAPTVKVDMQRTIAHNIIADFYHSLNRKMMLTSEETEKELTESYTLLTEHL